MRLRHARFLLCPSRSRLLIMFSPNSRPAPHTPLCKLSFPDRSIACPFVVMISKWLCADTTKQWHVGWMTRLLIQVYLTVRVQRTRALENDRWASLTYCNRRIGCLVDETQVEYANHDLSACSSVDDEQWTWSIEERNRSANKHDAQVEVANMLKWSSVVVVDVVPTTKARCRKTSEEHDDARRRERRRIIRPTANDEDDGDTTSATNNNNINMDSIRIEQDMLDK